MIRNFIPSRASVWSKNYVTYRRLWLDTILESFTCEMHGLVLDIGGKREDKRGSFRPPAGETKAWWYLNLELSSRPNVCADATALPLKNDCADVILCTEVLEHLEDPDACIDEIFRLLRKDGSAFVSVPFMYPVHADPFDFQRFTADGLQRYFADFSSVEIIPMGSYLGTLGMLIEIGLSGIVGNGLHKKILRRILTLISRTLCSLDLSTLSRKENLVWQKFTTGYFLKATK